MESLPKPSVPSAPMESASEPSVPSAPMESPPEQSKQSKPSAPPIDLQYYFMEKRSNKDDSIQQIANKLGISVEQAQKYESQIAQMLSGGKSRRHAKKSRRHSKKSRRHAKKSRRHAKKSRR